MEMYPNVEVEEFDIDLIIGKTEDTNPPEGTFDEILEFLRDGGDPNAGSLDTGTGIYDCKDPRVVKLFLSYGAHPDYPCMSDTPLITHAMDSDLESVKLLIATGANPNLRNEWGVGAIDYAMQQNDREIFTFLLMSGADTNYSDVCHSTRTTAESDYKSYACLIDTYISLKRICLHSLELISLRQSIASFKDEL
jgi:ankyrin repeat protein